MSITKTRLALAIVFVVAFIAPTIALATHQFSDVDDTAFYAEPVEWAKEFGITTGKSPTEFAPNDGVTRGESVTFLQRYDTNVVYPQAGRVAASSDGFIDNWDGSLLSISASVDAPADGYIVVTYNINLTSDADETGTGFDYVESDIWSSSERVSNLHTTEIDFDSVFNSESASVQATLAVAEGLHTFTGFSNLDSGTTASKLGFVGGRSISVQFFPFDGDGASPSTFGPLSISSTNQAELIDAMAANMPGLNIAGGLQARLDWFTRAE